MTSKIGPDAAFTFSGQSCGTVQFTKTCQIVAPGTSTYQWNFGDGTTSTAQNPFHTYTTAGNYTVTLEVTDALGCVNTNSVNVAVSINNPPTVVVTPAAPAICAGQLVRTYRQWCLHLFLDPSYRTKRSDGSQCNGKSYYYYDLYRLRNCSWLYFSGNCGCYRE